MRPAVVAILVEEHDRSVVSARESAGLSRTAHYRPPAGPEDADAAIIAALTTLIAQEGHRGFWKCQNRRRVLGHPWNHMRIYRALKLHQVRRTKKRVPTRVKVPLQALAQLNDTWAMEFMGDTLYSARRYRILNAIDEGSREDLAIEVDVSLPSGHVVTVLEKLVAIHGEPRRIRCTNGPEFVAETLRAWCERHGISLVFIQPGKPSQNARNERFNRADRTEMLNARVFTILKEVRDLSEAWRQRYNTERTHDSLCDVPPLTFLPTATSADPSHNQVCA